MHISQFFYFGGPYAESGLRRSSGAPPEGPPGESSRGPLPGAPAGCATRTCGLSGALAIHAHKIDAHNYTNTQTHIHAHAHEPLKKKKKNPAHMYRTYHDLGNLETFHDLDTLETDHDLHNLETDHDLNDLDPTLAVIICCARRAAQIRPTRPTRAKVLCHVHPTSGKHDLDVASHTYMSGVCLPRRIYIGHEKEI